MPIQREPSYITPNIEVIHGLRDGERFVIRDQHLVIGRDESADIQLESPYVSRNHAEIIKEGGYWFLIDQYSKNGVFKNLSRIQPGKKVRIREGDHIRIGSVSVFTFHDPEATIHESEFHIKSLGLWLDLANHQVYIYNQRLEPPLSQQQFKLLHALIENEGGVLTNEKIAGVLWPQAAGGVAVAAIDNAISRLRSRLAEIDPEHDYIRTVRGVGKRFIQRSS